MIIQFGQSRADNFLTEISKIPVGPVLGLPFILVCLLAALGLAACSPRDPQREKDKALRQALVGVWSDDTPNSSSYIVNYNPDGSFWTSNTIGSGPSARGVGLKGTWNIMNGRLVSTNQEVDVWNWGTRHRPQLLGAEDCRIVWVTDQELALAWEDEVLNIHQTNILRRGVASQPSQSSPALEKDKALWQAVAGVWSGSNANISSGITSYNPDGSFWCSNRIGSGPSARGFTMTGTWNIINGRLLSTNQEFNVWNWGTRPRNFFPVEDYRIVWVTDQELAYVSEYIGMDIPQTNIMHRGVASKPPQSSPALEKANQMELSSVKFDGLSLLLVITMLHQESVKRDAAGEGVTISLAPNAQQFADAEVHLELSDVTLAETLRQVAASVGLKLQATDTGLLLAAP